MSDFRAASSSGDALYLEQRKVLAAAIEQNLVAETG